MGLHTKHGPFLSTEDGGLGGPGTVTGKGGVSQVLQCLEKIQSTRASMYLQFPRRQVLVAEVLKTKITKDPVIGATSWKESKTINP